MPSELPASPIPAPGGDGAVRVSLEKKDAPTGGHPVAPPSASPGGRDASGRPPVRVEEAAARGRRLVPRSRLGRAAVVVGLCVLVVVGCSAFVMRPYRVPSDSMRPTLHAGDRIMVNLLSYRFGGRPKRGDVIVFDGAGSLDPDAKVPSAWRSRLGIGGDTLVKRVIGVGGDRVACCDEHGRVTVDGVPLDERSYLYPGVKPSSVRFDVRVPKDSLFVMGDDRAISVDSRAHLGDPGGGMVPVNRVMGRVAWIEHSPTHWSAVHTPSTFATLDRRLLDRHLGK